jgi:hypothetical protein
MVLMCEVKTNSDLPVQHVTRMSSSWKGDERLPCGRFLDYNHKILSRVRGIFTHRKIHGLTPFRGGLLAIRARMKLDHGNRREVSNRIYTPNIFVDGYAMGELKRYYVFPL